MYYFNVYLIYKRGRKKEIFEEIVWSWGLYHFITYPIFIIILIIANDYAKCKKINNVIKLEILKNMYMQNTKEFYRNSRQFEQIQWFFFSYGAIHMIMYNIHNKTNTYSYSYIYIYYIQYTIYKLLLSFSLLLIVN